MCNISAFKALEGEGMAFPVSRTEPDGFERLRREQEQEKEKIKVIFITLVFTKNYTN